MATLEDVRQGDRVQITQRWRGTDVVAVVTGTVHHIEADNVIYLSEKAGWLVKDSPFETEIEILETPLPTEPGSTVAYYSRMWCKDYRASLIGREWLWAEGPHVDCGVSGGLFVEEAHIDLKRPQILFDAGKVSS